MYGELINMIFGSHHNFRAGNRIERFQTTSFSTHLGPRAYEKKTMSDNPFENLTLDRLAITDLSYALTENQTGRGLSGKTAVLEP